MKFRVLKKRNPQNLKEVKYYASAVNTGRITMSNFSKGIAGRSSLTRGDIENVLSNFLDEMPKYLMLGFSIELRDFGSFRLTIQSSGKDDPSEVNTDDIKCVRCVFTPSSKLKYALRETLFEKEKIKR